MKAKETSIKNTAKGTIGEMLKSADHLIAAHRDILIREKNRYEFTDTEITNFCKTLEGIQKAAQYCIDQCDD
ncbi:MAG: DNA-binding MltR family transcriptional regulator [Phenylobacterium sp.]|jgi:DNA-binding MltR family transcriptional regulator